MAKFVDKQNLARYKYFNNLVGKDDMPDGTERAAESRDEITGHDGLFGVERQTWHGYQENIKSSQTQRMLPSM